MLYALNIHVVRNPLRSRVWQREHLQVVTGTILEYTSYSSTQSPPSSMGCQHLGTKHVDHVSGYLLSGFAGYKPGSETKCVR